MTTATRHTYICTDGHADITIDAETAHDAAQEYVDGGTWGTENGTTWIRVYVQREVSDIEQRVMALAGDRDVSDDHNTGWWIYDAADIDIETAGELLLGECELRIDAAGDLCIDHGHERESHTIAVEPAEPECTEAEHDWRAPVSLLGGLKENPGVWGHGAGVIIRECCAHCGQYRERDTWAQNPETGEQGLESVRYEDADDASLTWLARRKLEAVLDSAGDVYRYEADNSGYTVTLTTGRLEAALPDLPDGVSYDVDLDDDEMDVVHIRILV